MKKVILFGSVARGDFNDESDIDVLVVGDVRLEDVSKITSQILLKYREVISAVVRTEDEMRDRKSFSFCRTVLKEVWRLHEEIAEQMSVAEECLEEAKLLLSGGFLQKCSFKGISKEMLLARDISPKKYAGVLMMLGVEFVNKGYLEETHAEAYKLAFDVGMDADYEGGIKINADLAWQIVYDAEEFLKKKRMRCLRGSA